jgi:hypothetical protein
LLALRAFVYLLAVHIIPWENVGSRKEVRKIDCPHCGALVQEGREICPACGGQVVKRSFWRRLLSFLLPLPLTRTKVTRTSKVVIGKPLALNSLPPEFRANVENALASGHSQVMTIGEIPPELRAKIQDAMKSGLPRLDLPDELSPELRAKIEEAVSSAKTQYLTLDQIPPELKDKFRDAIASGQGVAKQVFSYQGPDGQMHTCQSLDEMPEDFRAKLKAAITAGQGGTSQVFTFQGPDGQKHVYHSLEEMPEGIRAFFRIASGNPPQE